MKRFFSFVVVLVALTTLSLLSCGMNAQAQESSSLGVESATICRDVVAREPIDAGTLFPASVGRLYCFTKIVNIPGPNHVTHVWYHGDTERARVNLAVDPPRWRTYSSKAIQPHETGVWYVDVLGPEGGRLASLTFEVTR
jgi:hypothetical protein